MKKLLAVMFLVVTLAACTPPEMTARDGIAGAKGALQYLQSDAQYGLTCKADPAQPVCRNINRGVAAQNFAIDALMVYCGGPSFDAGTGPCQPPSGPAKQAALDKLNSAMANMNAIITDLKKVVKP